MHLAPSEYRLTEQGILNYRYIAFILLCYIFIVYVY